MLKIAFRNIIKNKKNSIIIFISFFIIIFSILFIKGIINYIPFIEKKSYHDCHGDIEILFYNNYLEPDQLNFILEYKEVKELFSYTKLYNAFFDSPKGGDNLNIIGIDFEKEKYLKDKWIVLDSGKFFDSNSIDEIILNVYYKYSLKLEIGDKIIIQCINKDKVVNAYTFKIVGFVSKSFEQNFISKRAMENLFNSDSVNIIKINLNSNDEKNIYNTQNKLKNYFNEKLDSKDFTISSISDYLKSSVKNFIGFVFGIMIIFFLIIFIISGILIGVMTYLSVARRHKEIGVYISLGFNKVKIISIFFLEKLIIILSSYLIAILFFLTASYYLSVKKVLVTFGNFLSGYLISIPKVEDIFIFLFFLIFECLLWVVISTTDISPNNAMKYLNER